VLIAVVVVLSVIYIIGFYKHERWRRQYTLIVEELEMKVSINHAEQWDLESLPGIGPALAQRIIEYRDEHGDFSTLDGLKYVKGIGEKKYQKILLFIKL